MQESDVSLELSDSEHRSLLQCSYSAVYGSTARTEPGLLTTSMSSSTSELSNGVPQSLATNTKPGHISCNVCYFIKPEEEFTTFSNCGHSFCTDCVFHVFERSVVHSRVDLQCLQCTEKVTNEEIKSILTPHLYQKYLEFSLKQYLATVSGVRYCPSPDCPYACIDSTENGMPTTNHFVCAREECHKEYCYQCKCPWHPDKSCQQAREEVALTMPEAAAPIPEETLKTLNAKQCPFCYATVEKLDDGSCNQVECINCKGSFCWLCGKSVTEMHYLSPTGCPMYGRQRWSRKKKYCCRFWLWITAPMFILLSAFLAFPIILIGLPILIGYVVYKCFGASDRCLKKTCCALTIIIAVLLCLLLDPLISVLGVMILVPLALFYIYCFIPIHVCMQTS